MKKLIKIIRRLPQQKYNPLYWIYGRIGKVIYDGYVRWGRMGRSAKEIEQI